jgi:hypothetical protein
MLRAGNTPWRNLVIAIGFATALRAPVIAQVLVKLPPVTPPSTTAPTSPVLPEPIYWKQHLFLIPYQWNSAAQAGAARAVSLFVSKDRGASWQKISDARPDVRSFNYRAEGDGEYWFAVRTLDQYNRWLPEGPYQAELRVIVDTTIPRIDELQALPAADGSIDVVCRATDVNLDPSNLIVETQRDTATPWQTVALQPVSGSPFGAIQTRFQPAAGTRPTAIRVRISDRAGNSAVYQSAVGAAATTGAALSLPPWSNSTANPFDAARGVAGASGAPAYPATTQQPSSTLPGLGWYSGAAPAAQPAGPPASQQWPANMISRAPFQLWTSGPSPQDDGLTAFGNPQMSKLPTAGSVAIAPTNSAPIESASRVPAHYANASKPDAATTSSGWSSGSSGPQFAPLEPYRETGPLPTGDGIPSQVTPIGSSGSPMTHQPRSQPKLVGSRTFALEYDLDGSPSGVARVELWGTRDGGNSWNRFALDNDNRSPLVATVDEEGLYGFKILVQNAGDRAAGAPRSGEEPELWVAVDLKRPIIELTAIERGEGNLADHLVLHWRAQDNNLEPRPISLYFSSRPGGPWSAIATSLEDTGQYAWRVERYVPSKIYLRIEARDTAGNLSAFQTREPVEYTSPQPAARLRSGL